MKKSRKFHDLGDSDYAKAGQLIQSKTNESGPLPISQITLKKMVSAGLFPAPIKLSAVEVWNVGEVREWLKKSLGARNVA